MLHTAGHASPLALVVDDEPGLRSLDKPFYRADLLAKVAALLA